MKWACYFSLVVLALLSRMLPHSPNFTPLIALSVLGIIFFPKNSNQAFIHLIPLVATILSDIWLGFYSINLVVYLSYLMMIASVLFFKPQNNVISLSLLSFWNALLFYFVTNTGVWFLSDFYSKDYNGLSDCLLAGIPFFRNTLESTFIYLGAFILMANLSLKTKLVRII